jgi:uncharacterized protein YcbX
MEASVELKVGTIRSLWRYPVRSMRGEELESVGITSRGIVGDRCYGVVDVDEGCCAESSYQPGRWAALLRGVAAFDSEPSAGAAPPPIKIQFDDGSEMSSNDPAISAWLSDQLGHAASLLRDEDAGGASIAGGVAEIRGAAQTLEPDAASAGTPARGYDRAPVHLVTTASLLAASGIHAEGQFVPARFRPNIVLDCEAGIDGFIESDWVGRTLAVGEELRLEISEPCERCSVPTLPQGDLVRDRKILSTITKHNATNMGVYARVAEPGSVRLGDLVVLLD